MLLPTMVPKCLPLELLFEIVPFIPAEKAVPNALSSCWLLHKLLLPRVIKWKEIMSDNINFKNEIREELKRINQKIDNEVNNLSAIVNNLSAKVDNLLGVVNNHSVKLDNLSVKVDNHSVKLDNLSVKVDNHSVKLETIEKKMGISGVVERFELRAGGRMPTKGNEKGGGSGQKSFHWNSADDQTWKVGLDEMANGEHSTENSRKKVKAIKRKTEKSVDDQSSA